MAINLIPEETSKESEKSDLTFYIVMSILTIFIVLAILVGKVSYNNYLLSQLQEREEKIVKDENALKEFKENINKYKNHPALTVLAKQTYYSELFEVLEKNTPDSVQYTSFSVDTENNINVSSTIIGSFKDAASFMKVLKKADFKDVIVSSLNKTEDSRVTFQINFTITKDMISK